MIAGYLTDNVRKPPAIVCGELLEISTGMIEGTHSGKPLLTPPTMEAFRHLKVILENYVKGLQNPTDRSSQQALDIVVTSLRVADAAAAVQTKKSEDYLAWMAGRSSTATFWQHLMVATSTKPAFDAVREASIQYQEVQAAASMLDEVKAGANALNAASLQAGTEFPIFQKEADAVPPSLSI